LWVISEWCHNLDQHPESSIKILEASSILIYGDSRTDITDDCHMFIVQATDSVIGIKDSNRLRLCHRHVIKNRGKFNVITGIVERRKC